MANRFFSSDGLGQNWGLLFLRVLTGALIAYHGWEIFSTEKMAPYSEWNSIKSLPGSKFMPYLGKGVELVGGIFLMLGLLTRLATVSVAIVFLFICFVIGKGEYYYGDGYPFLFALLSLVFFFTGAGKTSLDYILFDKKK